MFFLFHDADLCFVQLVAELIELVEQLLPLRSKRPQSFLSVVVILQVLVAVDDSIFRHCYFFNLSASTL